MKNRIAAMMMISAAASLMMGGTCFAEEMTEAVTEASSETAAKETQYPLTVTDDMGMDVVFTEAPEKIVSMSPAATEILFAVGAGDSVVGRTDYCNYPAEAAEVESIGSYSSPNLEKILAQSPQVVFASDYVDDAIRSQLEEAGIRVVLFSANDLSAVENDILMAGEILNLNQGAADVVYNMEEEMGALKDTIAEKTETKTAFVDLGSLYSAGDGSLLGNMLNDIGVENAAAGSGEMWPQLSVEAVIEANPDVYISLFTTAEELKETDTLAELDCIKNDRIIYIDGMSETGDMIQRPGPRLVEGTKALAELVYPELF